MSDTVQIHFRISRDKDSDIVAWAEAQDNLSASMRLLLRKAISMDGVNDAVSSFLLKSLGVRPKDGKKTSPVQDAQLFSADGKEGANDAGYTDRGDMRERPKPRLPSHKESESFVPARQAETPKAFSGTSMLDMLSNSGSSPQDGERDDGGTFDMYGLLS